MDPYYTFTKLTLQAHYNMLNKTVSLSTQIHCFGGHKAVVNVQNFDSSQNTYCKNFVGWTDTNVTSVSKRKSFEE